MNISLGMSNTSVRTAAPAPSQNPAAAPAKPKSFEDVVEIGNWGVGGAIPVFGAGVNLLATLGSSLRHDDTAMVSSFSGAVSNLVGSISLATGLIIGSNIATAVGAGLLVASGGTAGYAIARAQV